MSRSMGIRDTYTVRQLRAMRTLKQGPANDLKVDTGEYRVWVRREDARSGPAIVVLSGSSGRWEVIGTFTERLSPACQHLVER
jgi:hypothetical protein